MIGYLLLGFIVFQSVIHYCERKDLYDRIMSKNLTEYKSEPHQKVLSAHERVIKKWRKRGGEDKT